MFQKYNFIEHEDVYLVLLKYFKGDPLLLDRTVVKDLENYKYKGEPIEPIDPLSVIQELKNIISAQKKKREITYKYPEWKDDKEEIKRKLDEKFPEKVPTVDEPSDDSTTDDEKSIEDTPIEPSKPSKTIEVDKLLKQPWTLKELTEKIKELNFIKDKDEKTNKILKDLKGILILTDIQFKQYQDPIKNNIKFNYTSSFSTTEYSLAEKISHFILKETKQTIRTNKY